MTINTRSSTKRMVTRSGLNGFKPPFMELPQINKHKNKRISALPNIKQSTSFDFAEASREWHVNKKRLKNGMYVYICGKMDETTGVICTRRCKDNIGLYGGCNLHFMWEEK